MLEFNLTNMTVWSEDSSRMCEFIEDIHRLRLLILWFRAGGEKYHLVTIFFAMQARVVMNSKCSISMKFHFSTWLYEVNGAR